MVMIDALVSGGEDAATAVKTFAPADYGADRGTVLEPVLIECVAQTVAAMHGAAAQAAGRPPAQGMLVGVRDFRFHQPAPVGRQLRLSVEITKRLGPFCIATGRVCLDETVLAEGELKFYIADNPGPA